MRLRSHVAVAVAGSCSSDSTPRLGTSICLGRSQEKQKEVNSETSKMITGAKEPDFKERREGRSPPGTGPLGERRSPAKQRAFQAEGLQVPSPQSRKSQHWRPAWLEQREDWGGVGRRWGGAGGGSRSRKQGKELTLQCGAREPLELGGD